MARSRLVVILVVLVALALVGPACTRTKPGPNPAAAMARLLELVNKSRAEHGVAPLRACSPLRSAAQTHSRDMHDHNFIGHTGSDGSRPWDRAGRYGYESTFVGENVLFGAEIVEEAFLQWMDSPGHRGNILDPDYRHAGFAWYQGYWTQVFGADGVCQ